MPARIARGMCRAKGAANRRIRSRVTACVIPATGVRAPARMLVAVRAMRPSPAGRQTTATGRWPRPAPCVPCFGSWWSPDMRSATTAESSDSIAPSMATVSAGDRSVSTRSGRKVGTRKLGSPLRYAAEPAADGLDWQADGEGNRRASEQNDDAAGDSSRDRPQDQNGHHGHDAEERCDARGGAGVFPQHLGPTEKISRTAGVTRPKKSRIWVLAMRTPIPFVKPMTTGRGMYCDGGSESRHTQQDEHDASHQGAHEETVDAPDGMLFSAPTWTRDMSALYVVGGDDNGTHLFRIGLGAGGHDEHRARCGRPVGRGHLHARPRGPGERQARRHPRRHPGTARSRRRSPRATPSTRSLRTKCTCSGRPTTAPRGTSRGPARGQHRSPSPQGWSYCFWVVAIDRANNRSAGSAPQQCMTVPLDDRYWPGPPGSRRSLTVLLRRHRDEGHFQGPDPDPERHDRHPASSR